MPKKKKKEDKPQFYSLDNILARNATYNMIIGERSNGKTYAALLYGLQRYIFSGYKEQFAIVRRWGEDIKGKQGQVMFSAHESNNVISALTNGEWNSVHYYASKWWLCRYDQHGVREKDSKPFCYGFAISSMEHDKSTSYPDITTVVFDEFLTRTMYLPDEFVLFMNVISTIVRQRDNVKIFMLGNTVNKFSPYFAEMGLKNIKNQKQGTIDLYTYGDSGLKVAVEYCATIQKDKPSNKYFAFNNPKLQMVKTGTWEIDIYPHAPTKWTPNEVLFNYFIDFDGELLQADIIDHYDEETDQEYYFTFIHRKTSDVKNKDEDLIFSPLFSPNENHMRNIMRPSNKVGAKIFDFFKRQKVFFQDNEIGDITYNYINWCMKASNFKS